MLTKEIVYFLIYCTTLLYYGITYAYPLVGKEIAPAKENEFPFFVLLSSSSDISKKEFYYCGGTLISKKHVLTSEHCVEEEDEDISLIVNPANIQSRAVYKEESRITYEDWATDHNIIPEEADNDIAIVTLTEDVKDVAPAIISKLKYNRVMNRKVVAAGWGQINETTRLRPDTLMKANMKVLNATEYEKYSIALFGRSKRYRSNFYYSSASPPALLACGDSGGPLMLASNKELVGINDSSCAVDEPENNPHATSRHISIDYYREFIDDIIRD